ncbi:MAG TPA: C45 family peptidase [Planctomycetota bacterium]|nr:C45 family peptidase [Planctomycetota bacterium]
MRTVLLLLLLAGADDGRVKTVARHGRSWRGTIDGFPLLVLRGSPSERGEAHGRLAGAEILRMIDALSGALHRHKPGTWDGALVPAARRFEWPPRYEAELRAMAAALPAERRVAALGRDATLEDLMTLNVLGDLLGGGCSSFAAWGPLTADGRLLLGRTTDYTSFPVLDGFVLVATDPAEEGRRPTLELSGFGCVGASTALNDDGAFVALHDESGLPGPRDGRWAPRTLVLREAVEKAAGATAVDDVSAFLRGARVKMGNNVHVAGPAGPSAVLEWDGNPKDGGVTVRRGGPASTVCTNHYVDRAARSNDGSQARYDTLARAIEGHRATGRTIGEAEARAMLASVSRSGGSTTYFSVIVHPAARRYGFAVAPAAGSSAAEGRWIPVSWTEVFGSERR